MGGMGGLPPGMEGMMGGGMGGGMGGRGRGGRPAPEQPGVLPAGTQVVVRGLQGAAQHNGKAAEVQSYDTSAGRYEVNLADGDVLRIRFDNLLQTCACHVTGMQNRQELNGKNASIVGYDEAKGRYHADITGVGRASLQGVNLILPAGARWNDQVGKILSYDTEAGRYVIEMSREDQLRIK